MTTTAAPTAREIRTAALAHRDRVLGKLWAEDFTNHDFYLRLRGAWETVGVKVVDANTVVAWVRDRQFQYVASSALDVDAGDRAHIFDDGPRGAKILLDCPCDMH